MSLYVPTLYERLPVYDAKGFTIGHCVREVGPAGVTFFPINRDPNVQFNQIQEHVALSECALIDDEPVDPQLPHSQADE